MLLFLFTIAYGFCAAQVQFKTYVVYLNAKSSTSFNPLEYFDAKNIERKKLANLPLFDERDLPVNEGDIAKIKSSNAQILVVSRWLNAIFLNANTTQIEKIKTLPSVKFVDEFIPSKHKIIASANNELTPTNTQILKYQTSRLQAMEFERKNLTGKGIRIAVFDVGFSGAYQHPAFKHIYDNQRVIKTFDFITKKNNVYLGGAHGTNTLSCIAGIYNGQKLGMATDAEFLLARTEWNSKEEKQEEYFWLAAAEWADKNGANIISSSLGYGSNWYIVKDMDGKKSVVAFAATVAAQKGILVINSAGNEYEDNKWRTIITPSDADSVLCVGGTNPYTDRHIDFSSVGPTADFRTKPNVSAPGQVIAANPKGTIGQTFGTSFSCPLVSGFAACAWQSNRSLTNMQLFTEIEKSGHLYPYFDYMHGSGVPQASYFTNTKKNVLPNFHLIDSIKDNQSITFQVTDSVFINKYLAYYNYETLIDSVNTDSVIITEVYEPKSCNLYWNLKNKEGKILYYEVIAVESLDDITLNPKNIEKGYILTFHFEGYTLTKTIE
ncbi:MAG: S8 family serine peptidase [Bacteroidia bacterium]|nr:S8 family serine peptidase [Bacteroidia bacterium]